MKCEKLTVFSVIILMFVSFNIFGQASANLKAIHSMPEAQLATVDLYVSTFGIELTNVQNLPFRAAIPMANITFVGIPLDLGIAPGNSTSIDDVIATFQATLTAGNTYIITGVGVSDPAMYAPNPDALATNIIPVTNPNGRLTSSTAGKVEFFIVHGVTDAPTLDVEVRGGGLVLADNLSFGSFSNYVSVDPGNYILDVKDQGGNTLASYAADLTALADSALTVVASGFLNPAANLNGPGMVLIAHTTEGIIPVVFTPVVGIEHDAEAQTVTTYSLAQNYPNPFNPSTTIEFALPSSEQVQLAIYNSQGQLVETLLNQNLAAGVHKVRWEAVNLPSGVYFYRLNTPNYVETKKLMLLK